MGECFTVITQLIYLWEKGLVMLRSILRRIIEFGWLFTTTVVQVKHSNARDKEDIYTHKVRNFGRGRGQRGFNENGYGPKPFNCRHRRYFAIFRFEMVIRFCIRVRDVWYSGAKIHVVLSFIELFKIHREYKSYYVVLRYSEIKKKSRIHSMKRFLTVKK